MKLRRALHIASLASLLSFPSFGADDYKPGPDSLPQPGVPKGEMLKDKYTAKDGSVFPGTEREYQIYLPAGLDTSKPAPFMVFQDGVIYQAPVVFDNLIAKKEIPPLIGIFIKPGVVPAANDNALPRFNRSYEYDSVTDGYSRFLIDEFLPAIKARHKLNLSTDPNARGIAGSSSGGICAFMVAWHRPDSFRRVFTSVGTYVGIHGADQLPVLVRKFEPKPIRIYLQSGENDNNLYCGDWWVANQMMERSLTWNGYDVNHTWGTGGHNQKHATAIFPDVLRWLWKGYPDEPVKANPRGDAKWRGYEVVDGGGWQPALSQAKSISTLAANKDGDVFALDFATGLHWIIPPNSSPRTFSSGHLPDDHGLGISHIVAAPNNRLVGVGRNNRRGMSIFSTSSGWAPCDSSSGYQGWCICLSHDGWFYMAIQYSGTIATFPFIEKEDQLKEPRQIETSGLIRRFVLAPDQTQLLATSEGQKVVRSFQITSNHDIINEQPFALLNANENDVVDAYGLCVDTNGWLYVATALGIQVCDQAGRVNFIIPTPQQPHDVCFGGKDLSELFIACGDKIYKRQTKAHGYISGQMAPIKPPPPKL